MLLFGVEKIRSGAKDGFYNTVSQTDLIVGARGGSVSLLLYTIFHIGNATNNVSWETFEHFKNHPAVDWTIPISLGDGHRGFRVVATTEDFYKHYRFMGDRQVELAIGQYPQDLFDVVMGYTAAKELKYDIGHTLVVSHGSTTGQSFQNHDDLPFKVSGIMKPTGTPIDRSVFISLEAMEAIHTDWTDGAPPLAGKSTPADTLRHKKLKPKDVTAFLLRTKSRIDTLYLQRTINTYDEEPLLGIIPGVTLDELWSSIDYADVALRAVSFLVMIVGLVGMLIAIYSSLNERRREMAILRAIGVHASSIIYLFVLEAVVVTFVGYVFGVSLLYTSLAIFKPIIHEAFGIFIPLKSFEMNDFLYTALLFVASILISLIPAWRAYRNSLIDGLSIRN
jgi:putative ABC transport system permease protein